MKNIKIIKKEIGTNIRIYYISYLNIIGDARTNTLMFHKTSHGWVFDPHNYPRIDRNLIIFVESILRGLNG